jgi:hypothetical protein
VEITIDEAMTARQKGPVLARDEAGDFIKLALQKAPEACAKLVEKAELRNISRRTLYRAATELKVNKFNESGVVMWSLPVT